MTNINLKLTVINQADYSAVKEFCDFAELKGYTVIFVDNGNIIFEKNEKI
jgi:hypothetical protein